LNCLKRISARWLRQRDQVHTHTERPWPPSHFAASAGSARWGPSCTTLRQQRTVAGGLPGPERRGLRP